jgi:hypothetical protein
VRLRIASDLAPLVRTRPRKGGCLHRLRPPRRPGWRILFCRVPSAVWHSWSSGEGIAEPRPPAWLS